MQCDVCNSKKATVHLTEIVDEQISELHLCEDCAREKSVQMEQQFGLADLLAGLTDFSKQPKDSAAKEVKLKCAHCGLNYEEFRKLGRLGCSECYVSFREYLSALLKKIHGSNQHLGKSPLKTSAAAVIDGPSENILQELKSALSKAIQAENFEEAARLRDQIHTLQEKQGLSS